MLTGAIDERHGPDAIRAGADDYLATDDLTIRALRRALMHARERRRMQRQVQAAAQHRMIAHLAGSVAHDINNLLTVIRASAQALLEEQSQELVEEILTATQQGERLTRQLLAQGRKQPLAPQPMSLMRFFRGRAVLFERLTGPSVRVVLDLDPLTPHAHADPNALELMLYNLVSNAVDAMPSGGTLTLRTRPHVHGVFLEVCDTGVGIPTDLQQRVLEPFYTTKGQGAGSGLGLPSVVRTATSLGGKLELESTPGQGSTMRVLLRAAEPVVQPQKQPPQYPGHGECVLVVDDVPEVLGAVCRNLAHLGYETRRASDRTGALEQLRNHTFDLVLTDVMLGPDNGIDLAAELRQLGFGGPVLFMSGYSNDFGAEQQVLRPGDNFIQKPFGISGLSALLHHALSNQDSVLTWLLADPHRRSRVGLGRLDGVPARGERWGDVLEEPAGVPRRQVHAAVARRVPDPPVPVGGVDGVARGVVHRPGHRLDVVGLGRSWSAVHVPPHALVGDGEATGPGRAQPPLARRGEGDVARLVPLHQRERAGLDVDVDPALVHEVRRGVAGREDLHPAHVLDVAGHARTEAIGQHPPVGIWVGKQVEALVVVGAPLRLHVGQAAAVELHRCRKHSCALVVDGPGEHVALGDGGTGEVLALEAVDGKDVDVVLGHDRAVVLQQQCASGVFEHPHEAHPGPGREPGHGPVPP